MRAALRAGVLGLVLAATATALAAGDAVHPYWRRACLVSFRSPDLLTDEPDERWGREDGRLAAGGILSDFPGWLRAWAPALRAAAEEGRPVLIALHVHSGYGTGLVTYAEDLRGAEAADYPWLLRRLIAEGLSGPAVTVTVDTCNAQATAAHQIRPDLVPTGVLAWEPFRRWRQPPARRALPLAAAYRLFAQDRVAGHLARPVRGRRDRVRAPEYRPLAPEERRAFRGRLYGPKGVILGTPALFNVLRLGPEPRGTLTANLLTDRLETRIVDGWLSRNLAEFRAFRRFDFLAAAGPGPLPAEPRAARDSDEAAGEP